MYRRKTIDKWVHDAYLVMFIFFILAMVPGWIKNAIAVDFVNPQPYDQIVVEKKVYIEVDEPNTVDEWVDEAVNHYFDGYKVSEVKMIMHCLLHRESGHGASDRCGDNGKACGPLQFHNPTWKAYRKIMVDRGEAVEIGDRHDMKMAIWTTVWAIKDGRAKAWGPILRDSKGSDYAACQTPSWYSSSR